LAATTEPCPFESESGPDASLITPILTTPPEISPACAAGPGKTRLKTRLVTATIKAPVRHWSILIAILLSEATVCAARNPDDEGLGR
jgi:hypothetical protein